MNDSNRLDFLDALRAVAIAGVVLTHSGIGGAMPQGAQPYVDAGARGVQLFFAISGFLMFYGWRNRIREPGETASFFIRRFFRIAPLYYLALALTLYLGGFSPRYWAPQGIGLGEVFANILFVHGWFPTAMTSVVTGGWSIGDEMTFYLLVPLLVVFVRGPASAAALLLLSFGIASLSARVAAPLIDPGDYVAGQWLLLWPPAQFPAFCAGILAFFAWDALRGHPWARRVGLVLLACGASAVLALVIAGHNVTSSGLYGVAFATALVGLGLAPVGVLVNGPMQAVGRVSYSMYIVHPFMLGVLIDWDRKVLWFFGKLQDALTPIEGAAYLALFTGATLVVSVITYRMIEVPMIRLGSMLARRASRRSFPERTGAGALRESPRH